MNPKKITQQITTWLKNQKTQTNQKGYVIGISGGIDSAVTSTLCAQTGNPTICITLPILQPINQHDRAHEHIKWLTDNHPNVTIHQVDLTQIFQDLEKTLPPEAKTELSLANARARLRMTTLYTFANAHNHLVVGTGNKIEDDGIGFFTKYGDGGVDISPIGDLLKSEIYQLADHLGISETLRNAAPTDGLWGDDRTDEDQIGTTYDLLEWAMQYSQNPTNQTLTDAQKTALKIYQTRHTANRHKMQMPPICHLN